MYGMYPNAEQWRINLSFIALAFLGGVGFFASEKFKKYLTLYYVVVYPIIAFLPSQSAFNNFLADWTFEDKLLLQVHFIRVRSIFDY